MRKKIAVIGAGWTGLSAAAELAPYADITLFEAGRVAGGRARAVENGDFSFLDNGQHLLIGAYQAVFALMDKVGAPREAYFFRQPLQWYLADGIRFQAADSLPAPWNLATAVLTAKHASLPEKFSLLRQMLVLKKWANSTNADMDILTWLNANQVSPRWVAQFWQPMVWGALNTPLQHASLRLLCNVMRDGVWAKREWSDYYVPRVDLGSVFAEPVLQYIQSFGAKWQPETRVGQLLINSNQVLINHELFDAAIIATAPYHVAPLLPDNLGQSVRNALADLRYHAITTVYLRYAQALRLPALMTGFAQGTAQWLIDRSRLNGANEIAAVISVSDTLSGSLKTDWAAAVHQDVLRVCPHLSEPIAAQVITEKRATMAATVNRRLPEMADLNRQHIYVAGDWLHTRYPATLEAAVQSGRDVAQQWLADIKKEQ